MTIRTTRTTVSFSQPFKLKDLDDIQPAGDYLLDTDEELIEGPIEAGLPTRRNIAPFAIQVSSTKPHRVGLCKPG